MNVGIYMGPSHVIPSLPIRALNPDGSIELYDGRTFHDTPQVGIEFEHSATEYECSGVVFKQPPGAKFRVDVVPPRVHVRDLKRGLGSEYRFRGGNWYWMIPLRWKLAMLWARWWPWHWTRF
jgi:hypothetical protein